MKKPFSKYIIALVAAVSFLQACNNTNNNRTNKSIKDSSSEALYTCSMHPQILEHHPGNCPICSMKLIKKNATTVALNSIDLETLLKPTNQFVVSSLPITTPQQENIAVPVKAYGVIESDTRAAGTISTNVSGRIEKLYLRYRFQKIEAGQKVAEIYSPELLTAQENLLFILKNEADNISFINAAKQKLLLLGMSGTELNKIIKTRKPLYSVSVYSTYSGHVHDAGMSNGTDEDRMENNSNVTQPLSLKEGMYITKGQTLFMIMNHHKVWAALQIFPNQEASVKKGEAVKIIPETDTAAVINGTIDFIEPLFRNSSKTLTARVYFHNMDMLTIGSQVTANIYTPAKQGLWLPQSSVLTLGQNEVTFLKSGKDFTARKVTAGIRVNDKVQILSGLNSTDTVVANAQYLMDSESFVRINNEK